MSNAAQCWVLTDILATCKTVLAISLDTATQAVAAPHALEVCVCVRDLIGGPQFPPNRLPVPFDAAHAIGVLHLVSDEQRGALLGNIAASVGHHGTFVCDVPSDSQKRADELRRIWRNVYVIRDESGAWLALCTGATL